MHGQKRGFFGWFNRIFERSADGYRDSVGYVLKRTGRFGVMYLLLIGAMAYLFTTLPTSFLPEEDQGVFLTMVQLPTGATQERTQEVLNKVRDHYLINEKENVKIRLYGGRLQLCRYGAEHGHGLCADARLE